MPAEARSAPNIPAKILPTSFFLVHTQRLLIIQFRRGEEAEGIKFQVFGIYYVTQLGTSWLYYVLYY